MSVKLIFLASIIPLLAEGRAFYTIIDDEIDDDASNAQAVSEVKKLADRKGVKACFAAIFLFYFKRMRN